MKDLIRVVLVDPSEASRGGMQRLLGSMTTLWIAEVLADYRSAASAIPQLNPNLCLVNLDADPQAGIELIASICNACPEVVVLPASATADGAVILKAIRAGAREFLSLPAETGELLETIGRLFRGRESSPKASESGPQTIVLTGAAGGVGTTSIAVNLATSLAASRESETILIDFDLMFGSVDACLDIIPDHTVFNVVQNLDRLDLTLLKRSMIRHSSGLYVLPHPVALEDAAKIDPETLKRLVALLKAAFPTVVIDTSKGLQTSDFVAFEMADVILIVIVLDLNCLRNTARLLGLFRQFEGMADRVRLVVNRAGAAESEISIKKAEETLKLPISWQVPFALKPFQNARIRGVPIGEVAAGSRPHQAILEIARSLRPGTESERPKKGLFAAFF